MSKILKVVGDGPERLTYVEDAPPCENIYWIYNYETPEEAHPGHDETCPACHGTGLQAVELWPDARKAEWLQKKLTHWGIKACTDTATGAGYWWVWRRTLPPGGGIPHEYFISRVEFSEGGIVEAWSQALTAAVIAVAEVENG